MTEAISTNNDFPFVWQEYQPDDNLLFASLFDGRYEEPYVLPPNETKDTTEPISKDSSSELQTSDSEVDSGTTTPTDETASANVENSEPAFMYLDDEMLAEYGGSLDWFTAEDLNTELNATDYLQYLIDQRTAFPNLFQESSDFAAQQIKQGSELTSANQGASVRTRSPLVNRMYPSSLQ